MAEAQPKAARRPLRRAATRLPLAAAAAAGLAAPAAADGWSILARITETLEADSNLQLDPDSDGGAAGSTTTASVTFASATSHSDLSITPAVRGTYFVGDSGDSNLLAPQFDASYGHRTASLDFSSGISLDISPTTFSDFDDEDAPPPDLNDFDQNAIRLSLRANAGIAYRIDSLNTATLGVNASVLRYDRDSDRLSPSTSVGLNGGLSHALADTTSASLGLGLRRIEIDDVRGSTNNILSLNTGLSTSPTERLSFDGSVGLDLISTERDVGADDTGFGFSFDIGANWSPLSDFSLSLTASQSLEPSSEGDLETRTSIGLGATGRINERESVTAGLRYSREQSASTFEDGGAGGRRNEEGNLLRASLGYSWSLTPDLTANLGYAFRWRPDSDDEASSHNVSLTISKAFTLQP